jgi:hypothetical protein
VDAVSIGLFEVQWRDEGRPLQAVEQDVLWELLSTAGAFAAGGASVLAWAVGVRAVLDSHHGDDAAVVIDTVDQPVASSPGAMRSFEPETEWLADPVRALG